MLLTFGHITAAAALVIGLTISSFANADYQDTIIESFAVEQGGTLYVEADIGSITVRPGDTREVNVTIRQSFRTDNRGRIEEILEHLDIDMDRRGNDVIITAELDRRFRNSWFRDHGRRILMLEFEITVPATYNVDLRTSDDDIIIGDLKGSVECKSSDGDIFIGTIAGPVTATTSDGDIYMQDVIGRVRMKTSDGDIEAANITGTFDATTSDGNIEVGRVDGPVVLKASDGDIRIAEITGSIDARISDGNITTAISDQSVNDSRLTTSDGDITLFVNPSCRFTIDAHASDGDISAEGLTIRLGRRDKHHLVANMNGGGPDLYLRTSDGDIRLRER